ncbi:MAG TPA: dephospho-CoA kinase [Gammaproteobacteria bacterium]|nr:dephospho-CoA kinase [Gammaproteobacteria bacterium]
MLKVGLTGGIGSGKSTVSRLFEQHNIPVIDTDLIARELVSDPDVLQQLVSLFGDVVIDRNGQLDRPALAQIVFNRPEERQKLEALLHPLIREQVNASLKKLALSSPAPYAIIVVPLLLESGFQTLVDRILVVDADEANRIARIKQRDDRSLNEIRSIMASQASDQERRLAADDIIENNSNINNLREQVDRLHRQYLLLSAEID